MYRSCHFLAHNLSWLPCQAFDGSQRLMPSGSPFPLPSYCSLLHILTPLTLASKHPFKYARFLSEDLHLSCVFHLGYPCKAHSNLHLLQVFSQGYLTSEISPDCPIYICYPCLLHCLSPLLQAYSRQRWTWDSTHPRSVSFYSGREASQKS